MPFYKNFDYTGQSKNIKKKLLSHNKTITLKLIIKTIIRMFKFIYVVSNQNSK